MFKPLVFWVLFFILIACNGGGGGGQSGGGCVLGDQSGGGSCPIDPPVDDPGESGFTIKNSSPTHGKTGVPVDTKIVIGLSQNIDGQTLVANSAFSHLDTVIMHPNGKPHVKILAEVWSLGKEIHIQPRFDLGTNTKYKVKLTGSVLDQWGNQIDGSRVRSFTTGSTPGSNPGYLPMLQWNQTDEMNSSYCVKVKYGMSSMKDHYDSDKKTYVVNDNSASQYTNEICKGSIGASVDNKKGKLTLNQNLTPGVDWFFSLRACKDIIDEDGKTKNICSPYSDQLKAYVNY